MADEQITAKHSDFVLISLVPDVCLTPIGNSIVPIPYPITHDLGASEQCSEDVFVDGEPAFLHQLSFVDDVQGDEPGTKGGVISGVYTKISHSLQHSGSVYINGHAIVRTGDLVQMNTKKP